MTDKNQLVIAGTGLPADTLAGQTAVVTGAGTGIGYEAARALLWLGANVVIAEINPQSGTEAERRLAAEFGAARVLFVETDVGDQASVAGLAQAAGQRFGQVDIVINNATIAQLGLVVDVPIAAWDASYHVNLRGPVLMARAFLPGMLARNQGVFVCVSSTGTAYMGAYETFKAAQTHLGHTLDAELEGTGVSAFTIGPGLVATDTAVRAIADLAPHMGMSVAEFFENNAGAVLPVEEAGAGFAVAVVLAEQFRGQEISSMQALRAVQPQVAFAEAEATAPEPGLAARPGILALSQQVQDTLREQSAGWQTRSLFERQWVIRDFRKNAGMPVEQWLEELTRLHTLLELGKLPEARKLGLPLAKLSGYYAHLAELAKGYERDPAKLQENLRHVYKWQAEVDALQEALEPGTN